MTAINWVEIYLDSNLPCREFATYLESLTAARLQFTDGYSRWTYDHELASLSVELNEDAAWWKKRNELDGFLFYPLKISAEQKSLETTISYCELMKSIVRLLRSKNVKFSVVGDFEFDN